MALPKLFTLLDALDFKKVNALRKYVLSKVGEASDVYAVFESVVKTKDKRDKYKDAESIISSLLPSVKIKIFSNTLSLLYGYAEDWMALHQLEQDRYSKDLLVQRYLNDNGLYHLSNQSLGKMMRTMDEEESIDLTPVKSKFEMLFEHLFSTNMANYDPSPEEFKELIAAFDEYVSAQSLILLTELNNRKDITHFAYENEIDLLHKKVKDLPATPLTQALQLAFKVVVENDLEAYIQLKDALISGQFAEGSKMHYLISNYVIIWANRFWVANKYRDANLIIQLIDYGMKTGIFFNNGKLPSTKFHNLVMQLSTVSTFEKVNEFIEDWIEKVNTENKAATKELATAINHFYNHDYDILYKLTQQTGYSTFNEKNIAKGLFLISVFVERYHQMEFYQSTLQKFSFYLERNDTKMSTHLLKSYQNLIRFMKDVDKIGKDNIDLNSYTPLLYRTWCEYVLGINTKEKDAINK